MSHAQISWIFSGVSGEPYIGRDVVPERFWQICSEAFQYAYGADEKAVRDIAGFVNAGVAAESAWEMYTKKFQALLDAAAADRINGLSLSADVTARIAGYLAGSVFGEQEPQEQTPTYEIANKYVAGRYDRLENIIPLACNSSLHYVLNLVQRYPAGMLEVCRILALHPPRT